MVSVNVDRIHLRAELIRLRELKRLQVSHAFFFVPFVKNKTARGSFFFFFSFKGNHVRQHLTQQQWEPTWELGLCFHPQRSGAARPNNINTRQAGKTHLFACLSVASTTSESHFHKGKKKNQNKKTPTLCWNTVVEAKTGTAVKSKLRSRPSLRRQQEEHNNESESQNPVTSRVFFFCCFILLGNFTCLEANFTTASHVH